MTGVFVITLLAMAIGALLGATSRWFPSNPESVIEQIDALLPQTQCAQCGYPGCRPYAQAIADGSAPINQCPPGGEQTITAIADLLGREVVALNKEFGEEKPPVLAYIVEADCIGCTLCIHACPVDAIVGSNRLMHTVLAEHCTGCELCIAPCPVDCIELHPGKHTEALGRW